MDVDGEPGTTRATIGVVNTELAADRAVVLVVEDDPHIAELLDSYLRQDGYRPVAATDGEQAIALFHERCPSLVLLDLGLPGGVDGVEVCRRLRRSSDVPIIMLTARSDEVDRVLGFEVGTDDYVMKPFSPRELMGRVRAVLRRSAGSTPAAATPGSMLSELSGSTDAEGMSLSTGPRYPSLRENSDSSGTWPATLGRR